MQFSIKDLSEMRWSYSKLNSFGVCRRSWKYSYIDKLQGVDNFFSSYGKFFHSLLEKYDKGELELFELLPYYEENFDNKITAHAPPNKYVSIRQSYFDKGYEYLSNFEGHNMNTILAEMKLDFQVPVKNHLFRFVGYIDRLSQDEQGLHIIDYKSKSKFKGSEKDEYLRQLYLYSIGLKQQTGEYPVTLSFDMFKESVIVTESFDETKIQETLSWVEGVIETILQEKEFLPEYEKPKQEFWCRYICSFYNYCIKEK